jgi:tetratricopeptide (TPR) repeat protein
MSDIFISYAREDREKAELLARVFEQQKWDVWWDKVIPPGEKFGDVIAAQLAAAKAVIVLWSHVSVASDWVKDEAQEGGNRKILVPVLMDKISPPYGFRQVQTADLSEWDGSAEDPELQRVLRSVGALISKPVSDAVASNDQDRWRKRLVPMVVVAAVLVLVLGYAGIKFLGGGVITDDPNPPASPSPAANAKSCEADSRHKAADLTGRGLISIDPGGNQAAAVLQFNEAISECSSYADAYFWRGQSFVALQQNERAIADFRKVVELTSDSDQRQQAQKFVADLEGPRPTPVPTPTSMNANNTVNTNQHVPGSPNPTPTPGNQVQPQVNEIFAADKSKRIGATTRLIIEKKNDPATVKQSVNLALENPDNKSGVNNTLVYLENADPAILKQNRSEIEKLLRVSESKGTQTAEHTRKVRAKLNE